jgi:PAS domain S-box-containing protein
MLVGFYLIFTFGEKTSDRTKKIQSKIIFYTALLALSIGIITDFVLPKLYFYIIPPLGDVVILIWIMGLVYSITKYEFLITPATASKNIISTMSDSLILINQEGNIIDINKSTINLLGYSKNQLIDKHIQMLFSDNNLTTVLFDKTSKEGCLVNQKVILKKNTGEDIITLFSCSALKDEFGTIVGFVCTITDITESEKRKEELRKAKEEIEKKNEKLMQINEMKSEFLSMVSHEIKTPLTIMKEFISIVLDRIPGEINETQEEYLNIAYNNINRLEVIVNDLLDISKLEAGKMKLSLTLFDISTLIKDTVTAFNSKLKSNKIELNYFLQKPLPKVYADPTRISQVLNNLVENAFKYTPDGGKITIGAVLKNSFIEISVTDTGPGIPPEDLDKIFDRFEQLGQSPRTVTKSAGLGLSISKKIVELSGGKIWAESPVKDGKGSKFTFTLPKAS